MWQSTQSEDDVSNHLFKKNPQAAQSPGERNSSQTKRNSAWMIQMTNYYWFDLVSLFNGM